MHEYNGFQTAPLPERREEQEREARSRELRAKVGKVAGAIILGIGLVGIIVAPVVLKTIDERLFGFSIVACIGAVGVMSLGCCIIDQAASDYPCCDQASPSESLQ